MATIIQSQFFKFHDEIKLEAFENKEVAEKRDMLIDEITAFLKKKAEESGKPQITFSRFNQGSYDIGTGNKAARDEDDYDIDTGLVFNINKDDYTPLQVKQWVFDALNAKQFRTVEWKKACIRVQYVQEGLPKFHVDFAVYSSPDCNSDKRTYIAKGKPTISSDQNKWEISEPKKLKTLIADKFSDSLEKSQFLRAIRFYKRWKDENFTSVNGKPTGIALTSLAYKGFRPFIKDPFNGSEKIDDLKALIEFTKFVISQFGWKRITTALPVPPYNDLFEKMTDDQCQTFKEKLERLKKSLVDAEAETDPHEACKILRKEFGDDFPVPDKQETGQQRRKALAGTSESA
jgi:hypothetical protein